MGMLPEVRELDLSDGVSAPAGDLGRAIQVVRDCTPKALRLAVKQGRYTVQQVKEFLLELCQIMNTSGATHLHLSFNLSGQGLLASMASHSSMRTRRPFAQFTQ